MIKDVDEAIRLLHVARAYLIRAKCPQTLRKVRSAIKSAEGARRHIERRVQATETRDHILRALAGDPVAIAENFKIVEQLRRKEQES
jgi:hypothetical protein